MRSQVSMLATKWWRDLPLLALAFVFVVALGAMVAVSSIRPLSQVEAILFQLVTLIAGLLGSYRFGRNAAREGALEIIRPHARSAVRSILTLHTSLYELSRRIEDLKSDSPDHRLDLIQAVIEGQIPLGASAVEDWKDVAPNDVDEVIRQWPPQRRLQENDNSS